MSHTLRNQQFFQPCRSVSYVTVFDSFTRAVCDSKLNLQSTFRGKKIELPLSLHLHPEIADGPALDGDHLVCRGLLACSCVRSFTARGHTPPAVARREIVPALEPGAASRRHAHALAAHPYTPVATLLLAPPCLYRRTAMPVAKPERIVQMF
jgi:hypothetical protein